MAPRDTFHAVVAAALLGTILIAVLSLVFYPSASLLVIPWVVAWNFMARRIRCPSCGKEVNRRADGLKGMSTYRLTAPRRCDQCATRLDVLENE